MMVIEGGLVFFGALQNPCPNILVLDVLEVLDAMAALTLEELAALHWDTVNQVRTATEISRFALGQVDPTAALGGTAANLPHFLSSQDLVKPTFSWVIEGYPEYPESGISTISGQAPYLGAHFH